MLGSLTPFCRAPVDLRTLFFSAAPPDFFIVSPLSLLSLFFIFFSFFFSSVSCMFGVFVFCFVIIFIYLFINNCILFVIKLKGKQASKQAKRGSILVIESFRLASQ